jgi:large subunit ribosomal protein L21
LTLRECPATMRACAHLRLVEGTCMYAVVATGGKQYRVAVDDEVVVEKLDAAVGDTVSFETLLVADGDSVTVDRGSLESATVSAEVLEHFKGDKVMVFKFKRRKGYKRTKGHRQQQTRVRITDVTFTGAPKRTTAKAEATSKPETPAKSATKKPAAKKASASKETAAKKPAAKKAPAKKASVAEATAGDADVAVTEETAAKKPAAKKAGTSKETASKKPAAKKAAAKAKTEESTGEPGEEESSKAAE